MSSNTPPPFGESHDDNSDAASAVPSQNGESVPTQSGPPVVPSSEPFVAPSTPYTTDSVTPEEAPTYRSPYVQETPPSSPTYGVPEMGMPQQATSSPSPFGQNIPQSGYPSMQGAPQLPYTSPSAPPPAGPSTSGYSSSPYAPQTGTADGIGYPQAPYGSPSYAQGVQQKKTDGFGIVAVILAVFALLLSWFPFINFFSWILILIAIGLAIASIVRADGSKVLGWIAVGLSVLALFISVGVIYVLTQGEDNRKLPDDSEFRGRSEQSNSDSLRDDDQNSADEDSQPVDSNTTENNDDAGDGQAAEVPGVYEGFSEFAEGLEIPASGPGSREEPWKLNTAYKGEQVTITVNGLGDVSKLQDAKGVLLDPPSGSEYVVVDVSVTNSGDSEMIFPYFALLPVIVTHETDKVSYAELFVEGPGIFPLEEDIKQGETASGLLVFKVPQGEKFDLMLGPDGPLSVKELFFEVE